MEQKPQWDKSVPILYVFDTKRCIAHLKTILGSNISRLIKQVANINAVITIYENRYDGTKKIFLIEGKEVDSLQEALLDEGPIWIEVGAMFISIFWIFSDGRYRKDHAINLF